MRQSCHKFCHGRLAVDKTALHRATAASSSIPTLLDFILGSQCTRGAYGPIRKGRALLRYQQQRATVVSSPQHITLHRRAFLARFLD
ncbi:hypothetical protein CEXT_487221 [Caerostris extrusa]|uniref:Uncharacterized protein n=1 Tax=Caerostris extrusa TaxID=172846 RepID=A0AAV4MHA8_CAEEX|nr:hypothetical protein CEXT_487221 [Caerostris extrusa]